MAEDHLIPLDYAVIGFPGNRLKGEIAPEIYRLAEEGLIRIVDLIFISKDNDGQFTAFELNDLTDDEYTQFVPLAEHIDPLFTFEDVTSMASYVPPDYSALVILWQNIWTEKLRRAVAKADGQLLAHERIPAEVLKSVMAELAAQRKRA